MIFKLILTSAAFLGSAVVFAQVEENCGIGPRSNSTNEAKSEFKVEFLGYDYDDIPVILYNWGKWKLHWLVTQPEDLKIFERNFDEWIRQISEESWLDKFNNGSSQSVVAIVDFDGLDLLQLTNQRAMKVLLNVNKEIHDRVGNMLRYGFHLNANPLAEQVIEMGKPIWGDDAKLYELHGTNSKQWIPHVLRKIPRSQLPPKFRGDQDFQPVATCYFL